MGTLQRVQRQRMNRRGIAYACRLMKKRRVITEGQNTFSLLGIQIPEFTAKAKH